MCNQLTAVSFKGLISMFLLVYIIIVTQMEIVYSILQLGLDQQCAGARYQILSTAAVPIPIMTVEMWCPHSLGQTYVTYVAHAVRMFHKIMLTTLCFETYETNCRLETVGVHATVLTVKTGK